MHTNFYATLERGFTAINEYLGKHSGPVSLVGAGPSIKETYKELTGDVIAINSAIGFLLDRGIVPRFALLWDGAEIVSQFARPHPDITYLVASRCHPKVFERLKDCKVIVWHAAGDHDIYNVMIKPEVMAKLGFPQPLIGGGSAGVTRGMFVATALGYTDIHLFGADSSYSADGKTHVNGSLVPEKDVLVSLGSGERSTWFRTTPEWCAQVNEYKAIYALSVNARLCIERGLAQGMKHPTFTVHGGGLLRAMHERLVEKRAAEGDDAFIEAIAKENEQQRTIDMKATESYEQLKGEELAAA